MMPFRVQYLRSFLPTFRFFDLHDGKPVVFSRNPGESWVRRDSIVRLGWRHLFLNPEGNLLLWEESLFRAFIEHPSDSELQERVRRVLSGKYPAREFRLILEGERREVLGEVRVDTEGYCE
jgi:hypothetical protein